MSFTSLAQAKQENGLINFLAEVRSMLDEKRTQYGERGGFYDTNEKGSYTHALGEAKLKLQEFQKTGNKRMLIKAITWLYLVYEMETQA